jgi:SDR family mycofactocin-dependent oxidoreductase
MLRHDGKVVFITGAARGIGRAAAELFASEGADIVACDVSDPVPGAQTATAQSSDLQHTESLVVAAGRTCLAVTADVRSQASLDEAVAEALRTFGRIDVVIANAGIMHSSPFWLTDEATWQAVLDINLSGVWRTAKAVTPHLIEQRSGVILATASVQARAARHGLGAYTASKHGLLGLIKSMALELGEHNVRVNAILPGAIETPMIDNEDAGSLAGVQGAPDSPRTAFFRKMSVLRNRSVLPPSAIASAMSWLSSEEAMHITGIELPVDAGSLILPGLNHAPVRD